MAAVRHPLHRALPGTPRAAEGRLRPVLSPARRRHTRTGRPPAARHPRARRRQRGGRTYPAAVIGPAHDRQLTCAEQICPERHHTALLLYRCGCGTVPVTDVDYAGVSVGSERTMRTVSILTVTMRPSRSRM